MLLNVAIIGIIFFIVCFVSLAGYAATYSHDDSPWQAFFELMILASVSAIGICFIVAIVLLLKGG